MQKTLIIVLIVAVVALSGVLVWQRNIANQITDGLRQQITSLQNQITKLQSKNLNPNGEIIATTSNETARWKTYRNGQYGFEIKYPETWIVNDTMAETFASVAVRFFSNKDATANGYPLYYEKDAIIEVQLTTNFNKTLQSYFDEVSNPGGAPGPEIFVAYTTIAGDKAIKAEQSAPGTDGLQYVHYVKNNILFNFMLQLPDGAGDAVDNNFKQIFNQMLSTFKFTN